MAEPTGTPLYKRFLGIGREQVGKGMPFLRETWEQAQEGPSTDVRKDIESLVEQSHSSAVVNGLLQ